MNLSEMHLLPKLQLCALLLRRNAAKKTIWILLNYYSHFHDSTVMVCIVHIFQCE